MGERTLDGARDAASHRHVGAYTHAQGNELINALVR
jgi:hypothetical protein